MTEPLYRKSWESKTPDEVYQTQQVQKLNDRLRTLPIKRTQDLVVVMGDLQAEDLNVQTAVHSAAANFKNFTEDNDPHGEHDCATIRIDGSNEDFMFKIDYYDLDLRFGSETPWNPDVTRRVMTLMYAKDR